MERLIEKLQEIEQTYFQLGEQLSSPDVLSNSYMVRDISKKRAALEETIEAFNAWKSISQDLKESQELIHNEADQEMRDFLTGEIQRNQKDLADLVEKLRVMLLPKDPNDDKDIMLEIRGSAGGDEANIFAADMMRMYMRYADSQGWK
ncbi:MAG: PCRF domain-containing protein, partial [Cyanobacteria bacterium]|nr:PCRF domain-containing protein [Cyanobacteriota bacterium]